MLHRIKKSCKIIIWFLGIALGVILLFLTLLQIPVIQNKVKEQMVSYLESTIHTKVSIGKLIIAFPGKIRLEEVYLEDQKKDTLFYAKRIGVDIKVFHLLKGELNVPSARFDGVVSNIKKDDRQQFNFDYIIRAFETDTDEEKEEPKGDLRIQFGEFVLNDLYFNYQDDYSNQEISVNFSHFVVSFEDIDLNKREVSIDHLVFVGAETSYKRELIANQEIHNTAVIKEEKLDELPLKVKINRITVSDISGRYNDRIEDMMAKIYLGILVVEEAEFESANEKLIVETLFLDNIHGNISYGAQKKIVDPAEKITEKKDATDAAFMGLLSLEHLRISRFNFKYNDFSKKPLSEGFDRNHMFLKDLAIDIDEIRYEENLAVARIKNISFYEENGFVLQDFSSRLYMSDTTFTLNDFVLKTDVSGIEGDAHVDYPSLEALTNDIGQMEILSTQWDAAIGFKDIFYWMPDMKNTLPAKGLSEESFHLKTTVSGNMHDLKVSDFYADVLTQTRLKFQGRIKDLMTPDNMIADIEKIYFSTSREDILLNLPADVLPESVQIPNEITLEGNFKGGLKHLDTNLNIASSWGTVLLSAHFDQRVARHEEYILNLETKELQLGRLISNDSIGPLSLKTELKGVGLDWKQSSAITDGELIEMVFNGYRYSGLTWKGQIREGVFDVEVEMDHNDLAFDLTGQGNVSKEQPEVNAMFHLKHADLKTLGFSEEEQFIETVVEARFPSADIKALTGSLQVYDTRITHQERQIILDTLTVVARHTDSIQEMKIRTPFLDADFTGAFAFSEIGNALQQSINRYYTVGIDSLKRDIPSQQMEFSIRGKKTSVLTELFPSIKSIEPFFLTGNYHSEDDYFLFEGDIPEVVYRNFTVSQITSSIETSGDKIHYALSVKGIQTDSFQLPFVSLTGTVSGDQVNYALQLKDFDDRESYYIAGVLEANEDDTYVSLYPEKLVLNYDNWEISEDNRICLSEEGFYVRDFDMKYMESSLYIHSESEEINSPLLLEMSDFKLETLTNFAAESSFDFSGDVKGMAKLWNWNSNPFFTANIEIDHLAFQNDTIGNVLLKVDNETESVLKAFLSVTGHNNQVELAGGYDINAQEFDIDLDIKAIYLESIQPFTKGNLKESTGYWSGAFTLKGTADAPVLVGGLQFNDVGFNLVPFNAVFQSMNDSIEIYSDRIEVNSFKIKDTRNNTLSIDGTVLHKNISDFVLDLTVTAANFNAMNSKASDNELFYGEVFFDTDLSLKGTPDSPKVEGKLKINKDTRFTVVLPQSDPSITNREGVIEFIDLDRIEVEDTLVMADTLSRIKLKGINAFLTIEVDKEAYFSMIMDKVNGDYLSLKGAAQLSGGIDPSGKMSLTGRYEFEEGTYQMSFNMIRRKFDIKKGSYLLWTGEPTSADMNITAVYKSQTSPLDLVSGQLGNVSPEIRNQYRQRIPFETELNMKGELLKPEITFNIVLPSTNAVAPEVVNTTQAKLAQLRQDPNEMNKQVFALLLLNRFIGENPFASATGGVSASNVARQSASRILSDQLNQLAGDLIGGVELEFDLESTQDFTAGQEQSRTDLNVSLSKKMFDDRLKITVGSSFGLEGERRENEEVTNIAGDISADYQLTRDGRYRVRAYRKNLYQVALLGEVVETGVSFIITMDYDQFREIFKTSKQLKNEKK